MALRGWVVADRSPALEGAGSWDIVELSAGSFLEVHRHLVSRERGATGTGPLAARLVSSAFGVALFGRR
jgi:hypothetical protein